MSAPARREEPIALSGSYQTGWRDFTQIAGERYGAFRYLAVAVKQGGLSSSCAEPCTVR
jgi:hypothetical protein